MKKKISFTGLLALLIFVVSISCSKDDDDISYDLVGSWKVTYYVTAGDLSITKEQNPTWPEVNGGEITATFGEPDNGDEGILSGFTVSNSYTGSYTAKKNGELSIGFIASTLANEPEWTSLYNISAAQEYEVNGDELFIYYNDRTEAIVFERN